MSDCPCPPKLLNTRVGDTLNSPTISSIVECIPDTIVQRGADLLPGELGQHLNWHHGIQILGFYVAQGLRLTAILKVTGE